jgi:hypothetical protein
MKTVIGFICGTIGTIMIGFAFIGGVMAGYSLADTMLIKEKDKTE